MHWVSTGLVDLLFGNRSLRNINRIRVAQDKAIHCLSILGMVNPYWAKKISVKNGYLLTTLKYKKKFIKVYPLVLELYPTQFPDKISRTLHNKHVILFFLMSLLWTVILLSSLFTPSADICRSRPLRLPSEVHYQIFIQSTQMSTPY